MPQTPSYGSVQPIQKIGGLSKGFTRENRTLDCKIIAGSFCLAVEGFAGDLLGYSNTLGKGH